MQVKHRGSEICKGDLHASVFTPQAVAIATMVRKVPPTLWILVAKGMKVFCSEGVKKIKNQKQRESSDYCLT